jgi:hypothetical protein
MEIIMTEVHPGIAALAEHDAGNSRPLFSIRCGHRKSHLVGTLYGTSGGYLLKASDLRVVDLPMTHRDSQRFLYWPADQIDDVGDQSVALRGSRCSAPPAEVWWRYWCRDLFAAARTPAIDYVFIDTPDPEHVVGVLKQVLRSNAG